MTALLRFNLSEGVDLSVVASRCPSNLTGADLYALCSDATLIALRRQIDSMDQQGINQRRRCLFVFVRG